MNGSQITEALKALNIRPDEIADERLAEVIRILFQLIEDLSEENEKLKAENQKLRDAINLLKGEQAKPDTKPSGKKPNEDISSEEERKNFLFFSGSGNVHKGLDLLLEAFSKSDKNLYICTSMDAEFEKVYKHELEDCPNIHYVGFIQMRSEKFYEIMDCCNYVVYPSCSEGSPGSVIDCLQYGLIPIVSKELNIDVQNHGILLKECSIEEITKIVNEVSNKPIDWIREKSLFGMAQCIVYPKRLSA